MIKCVLPEGLYDQMKSLGITNEVLINSAYLSNGSLAFDLQPDGTTSKPNILYGNLVEYFKTQGLTEEQSKNEALIHVMYSHTPNFKRSMAGTLELGFRDTLPPETIVEYVTKLRENAIKREENRRNAVNNENVYATSFGTGKPTELVLDDIAGFELYYVLTPLYAEHKTDDKVIEIIQEEARALLNLENPSDLQQSQLDKLDKLLDNSTEVLSWYKKLHKQIDNNQIFESLVDEEPVEVQKASQSYDKAVVHQYDLASAKLRAIINSMPAMVEVHEIDGKIMRTSYQPKKSEVFGLTVGGVSKANVNIIGELLKGVTDYVKMHKILTESVSRYPQLEFLLKFLPPPFADQVDPKDVPLIAEFRQVFSLVETTPYIVNTSTSEFEKEVVTVTKMYSRMAISLKKQLNQYDSQLFNEAARAREYQLNGELNLRKVIDAGINLNKLVESSKKRIATRLRNPYFLKDATEFLYAIGFTEARQITLGTDLHTKFVDYFSNPDNKNALTILYRKLAVNFTNGKKTITNPLNFLAYDKGETLTNVNSDLLGVLTIKESEMQRVMNFFAALKLENYSPTYFNGANDQKYSKSEPFHLNQLTNALNQTSTLLDVYMDENLSRFNFFSNPDIEGSQWISRSFVYERTQNNEPIYTLFPSSRKELLTEKFRS